MHGSTHWLLTAAMIATGSAAAAQPSGQTIANEGLGSDAAPCTSCHGADGGGNPAAGFPRLAGIGAPYLADQLDAFASGARDNAVMKPIAQALSDDQRRAVAEYYSGLSVPEQDSTDTDDIPAAGVELAEHGRWSDGLPACVQCHGPAGVGVGERFPPLAGQSATYIENQLRAWRNGKRPGGPMGLMAGVAAKLEEADLAPVARYFAAQSPTTDEADEHE